jgi:uncharacterized protein (TIGR00299 family) protein
MKTAYFDCFSGVSGNMILGAFLDAGLDVRYLKSRLAKLALSGYSIRLERTKKAGIVGLEFNVSMTKAGRRRRSLREIKNIIHKSRLNDNIKGLSFEIFTALADAESQVHGYGRDKAHFHEIGDTDSIVDIVGTAIALDYFKFDEIYSSPINTGSGMVRTRHGIFPIPAPAAGILLKSIPAYCDGEGYELATPTGIAILKSICDGFCRMPLLEIEKIGHGAGTFDRPGVPNILRLFIGRSAEKDFAKDKAVVIQTNIDDMNLIATEHIMERIFSAGALDVYFRPVYMKKTRMGIELSVIAERRRLEPILETIFRETTTFGIRVHEVERFKLTRAVKSVKTRYGTARVNIGRSGERIITISPEYEDCRALSKTSTAAFRDVWEHVKSAAGKK